MSSHIVQIIETSVNIILINEMSMRSHTVLIIGMSMSDSMSSHIVFIIVISVNIVLINEMTMSSHIVLIIEMSVC